MKWFILIVSLTITITVYASSDNPSIILERLKSPASICVEGDPCAVDSGKALSNIVAVRTGEQVYNVGCAACHQVGAAGAPKTGESSVWTPRLNQGMQNLVKHAIEGYNAMPARGFCTDCSDQEIADAVSYMIDAI